MTEEDAPRKRWKSDLERASGVATPAEFALADAVQEALAAYERRDRYMAELLLALAPFSSAAEICDAINADRVDGSQARPFNYVAEAAFRDAFAAYTDRLDPEDDNLIRAALAAPPSKATRG